MSDKTDEQLLGCLLILGALAFKNGGTIEVDLSMKQTLAGLHACVTISPDTQTATVKLSGPVASTTRH